MNTRLLENWAFSFNPSWERRWNKADLADWMMLPLTLYSTVFLRPERGKLEYFFLFELEREGG